jgi:hypothetical protein
MADSGFRWCGYGAQSSGEKMAGSGFDRMFRRALAHASK